MVDVAKDGVTLVGEYEGSVTRKTKEGVTVEIKNVIYLPELIAVAHMRLLRNFYESQLELETTGPSASMCTSEVSALRHRCLGHASQHYMDTLVRHNMVAGLDPTAKQIGFCDTCVLGKLCSEPFDGTEYEPHVH